MKREKKAIVHNLEKLIDKYGYDTVRLTINQYYNIQREQRNALKDIQKREKELADLKKKLNK